MKHLMITLLAMMMALLPFGVYAEDSTAPSPEADALMNVADLSGFVMDITDELILIRTPDGLYVEALLTDSTVWETGDVLVGDFIHVTYNGMMTRSLPAQITAEAIRCHKLIGLVSDLTENGFLLTLGEEQWQINAEASLLDGIQDGMFVTVYHAGMMTMSLPPQVGAEHVRGQEVIGTVTEMTENGFTLTVEGEELPYHIFPREDALIFVQPEPGMEVIVVTDGLMTSGLDAIIINAKEILPLPAAQELFDIAGTVIEITGEHVLIQTGEGQLIQLNLSPETLLEGKEIAMGDYIHATYNGQMTFSIPAQIAALKIGCYTHTGVIADLTETSFILNTELEPIVVNLPEGMAEGLADGMTVTVYTNGAMTMSLPAQVGAEMILAEMTITD